MVVNGRKCPLCVVDVTCTTLKGISLHCLLAMFSNSSEGHFTIQISPVHPPVHPPVHQPKTIQFQVPTSVAFLTRKKSTAFCCGEFAPSICWCSMFSSKFAEPSVNSNDFAVAFLCQSTVPKESTLPMPGKMCQKI